MKPCKHLNYTQGQFVDCTLIEITTGGVRVRYWERGERWLEGPGNTRNPKNVQFCAAGRGRINGIFQCYTPGEMTCYEPEQPEVPEGGAG